MQKPFIEMAEKLFSMEGKRGIVTGGSAGLGKATALTLARAGAEVFIFSRTGAFKEETENIPGIHHVTADVGDHELCKKEINNIGAEGLDFLVNNAGTSVKAQALDTPSEKWRHIQEINVNTPFELSRFAYPFLKKAKDAGRIINISSMTSYMGFNDVSAYSTSKTALLGLTRSLAVEWANDNILVNAVSPGWILTDMLKRALDPDREKKILNKIAMGKMGTTQDIANMVWYLVSPAAGYITGQDFPVDGGALAFGY